MATARPAGAGLETVIERLEDVRCDISTLSGDVRTLASSYQEFRERYGVAHEAVRSTAEQASRRAEEAHARIDRLDSLVQQQAQQWAVLSRDVKLLVGLVGFIAAGVGGWLIGQFMGLL